MQSERLAIVALLIAVFAAYKANAAAETAQEAHDLARNALYQAQQAKTTANEVRDMIEQ